MLDCLFCLFSAVTECCIGEGLKKNFRCVANTGNTWFMTRLESKTELSKILETERAQEAKTNCYCMDASFVYSLKILICNCSTAQVGKNFITAHDVCLLIARTVKGNCQKYVSG